VVAAVAATFRATRTALVSNNVAVLLGLHLNAPYSRRNGTTKNP